MRTKGEGTVQTLPGGKFRGAMTVDGQRVFGPTVAKRGEALPALKAKLSSLPLEDAEPALSICVNRRIDWMISSGYSPTTVDLWRAALKRIEGDRIGDLEPRDVDETELTAWISRQEGAQRTVKNYADVIRRVLSLHGYKLEMPRATVKERRTRPPKLLSPTDQKELLATPMSPDLRVMVLLGLQLGLRRSEMAGLCHEDREGNGVVIRRAVVRATGAVTIKTPKTASSEAWVALSPELRAIVGKGKGYVLGDPVRPVSPSVLDDRWRRFVAKHKRFRGVGLHDLRRSFGMTIMEKGTDARTAAEMMRHDPKMLLDLYSRSRRDLKSKAIDRAFGKNA